MSTEPTWFHRRGTLSHDGWETVVDASTPGWAHTGLRVARFGGAEFALEAELAERIVVPLEGDVMIAMPGSYSLHLTGRESVFDGPTDVAYLPAGTAAVLSGAGRVAIAEAPATRNLAVQIVRAGETAVELRGAGTASRQVHNFGTPGAVDAEKLIVCEVITPAGNWSSYPPHKHDEAISEVESRLEEIYYFEAAPTRGATGVPVGADPFGVFATYGSSAGEISITEVVRTGDVALVPFGYHGPAVAAPGYDLYYLNVMAGPGHERAWRITDDPAHAWIRASWADESPDPRLPYLPPKG
jgi:5-deoxy-glucuronate isomerase